MASTIRVNFIGDTKDLDRAIDHTGSKLNTVGETGKKAALAIGVGAVAAGAALFKMADAAAEDEKAAAALAKTLENVTGMTGDAAKGLEDWISAQGKAFGVADDDLRPALDALIRGTKDLDAATELSTLAMDISAATGKDLTTVSEALAKAYNGQLGPLKKLDPALAGLVKEGASADQVFGALSKTFEGQAAAAADTTAGKLQIAKLQFAEMQEEIGAKVIPVLAALATFISEKLIPGIEALSGWLEDHRGVAIAAAAVIGGVFVSALIAWAAAAASAAVATIAAAAPVIAVTAAIALLVAGIIYAYKEWDWFRQTVDAVAAFLRDKLWPALQAIASFIMDRVVPVIATVIGKWIEFHVTVAKIILDIKSKVEDFVSFFASVPDRLAAAGKGMFNFIKDAFRSALNFVIDGWNSLEFKIPGFDPPGPGPSFGGVTIGVPDIPRLAKGGIVTSPTLALIGEAGPEAVVPLGRGGGIGGPIEITIMLDSEVVGRATVRASDNAGGLPIRIRTAS